MKKQPDITIVQGKSISKSDKELVESILGGEMKNAWQKGDGIDTRGVEGPYSKKGAWSTSTTTAYQNNYTKIKWR
jgi:hypothetical protein